MSTISVVIPVWNRAATVGRTIDSVLMQCLPVGDTLQCIIVDDGSTDDLAGALHRYGDKIKFIRHSCNGGAARARNSGIDAADGDFVAFLDSDDVWLPGRLEAQLTAMKNYNWSMSCSSFYLIRADGSAIVSPPYPTRSLTQEDIIWGCYVSPGSTLMVDRKIFATVGLFDVSLVRLEDWEWLLRATECYVLGFVASPAVRIKPSGYILAEPVLNALSEIKRRYRTRLAPNYRRKFLAAILFETAAAHFRGGHIFLGIYMLLGSLALVPVGHKALNAVLYNRIISSSNN